MSITKKRGIEWEFQRERETQNWTLLILPTLKFWPWTGGQHVNFHEMGAVLSPWIQLL